MMYLIRLDDASEYMDIDNWNRIESLLEEYDIKPIVGIIPNNKDKDLISKYQRNMRFWNKAQEWQSKKWAIALHGYNHICSTKSGGINPVNIRSEFADVSLNEQKQKIRDGIKGFIDHKLNPKIFFAPSHTFDMNTLEALRTESDIRIISDTVANDIYKMEGFHFIPQQSGSVRNLPFKVTTFCYHPNNMIEQDFAVLELFIKKNKNKFIDFENLIFKDRNFSLYDKLLKKLYFFLKIIKRKLEGFV